MSKVRGSIEVEVPVDTAYNQWTQFEEFPRFMGGVEEVEQLDDARLRWVAEIAGKREEWEAQITEQLPDERIAWRAISGKPNAGVVTFEPLDRDRTEVTVELDWEPEGPAEQLGAAVGWDDRQVQQDLERFRNMIEGRGIETGGWRGTVEGGSTV